MTHVAVPDRPVSLLSVLLQFALHTPYNDFLIEDKNISLSYSQSYALATQLIPARLGVLCPSLATSSNTKAILLTHNNTLCSLSFLALWSMSATVVPISTSVDHSLWAGMVRLISPELILVSPNLKKSLHSSIKEAALENLKIPIIDLHSLIPPEFLSQSNISIRTSDFIPSCHHWLTHTYPDSVTLQNAVKHTQPPIVQSDGRAVALFTSSAVDWATLKCVCYTHEMLVQSSSRAMVMLGGSSYSSVPKRHLGWLPLSHCFEFCIAFWYG
jgi:acyl-CoA synthetase (AMP-forming)/AMP-acid ligase II